jgi:hypothetical protein
MVFLSIRLHSGAGPDVTIDGFLGETSSLGVTHLPIRTFQTSETTLSEIEDCLTSFKVGIGRFARRSFALNHGSCLLAPHIAFFSQVDDSTLVVPPTCSDFIVVRSSSPTNRSLLYTDSFRDG